jgi:hypothetical protein
LLGRIKDRAIEPKQANMAANSDEPERPRSEPEIIPPGRNGGPRHGYTQNGYTQMHGAQRIYIGRIGPFGFALIMLVVGLLAAILLLALIGAALIWIPVVAVLVIIAAISGILRRL